MVKINGAFHHKATEETDGKSCAVFFIGEIDEILTLTVTALSFNRNSDDEYIKVSNALFLCKFLKVEHFSYLTSSFTMVGT